MKTKYFILAAIAAVGLASCADDVFLGDNSPNAVEETTVDDGAIRFGLSLPNMTRAGELTGATAAEKLGGMFVVEGTKGTEQSNSPSTTVVFDNYLVGYTANTAGKTESNTHNWEYVGLEKGITGRMTGTTTDNSTWTSLHTVSSPATAAQSQTIKYWDYSQDQYDFIAWSTGAREAVTVAPTAGSTVQVTRINTGSTLASNGFTLTAKSAADLLECYYTDIITAKKADNDYGKPVTLVFKNMAAKVRVALYETVPGYSVKNVMFYSAEATDPTAPDDLGVIAAENPKITTTATLFTTGSGNVLPQSGAVTVCYPHIGTTHRDASGGQTTDYNKASVTVASVDGGATSTTQTFGTLTAQYGPKEGSEAAGNIYLGRTLPTATFAGAAADDFFQAVIPNTNGKPLTLRVDYTLVSTDGSAEDIKVYGAKAVVPATYTVWQPNYAYTYIFKISDNSNGWTSQTATDPKGLFPITFDAVVAKFTDANAEQTTITTVATPSITTYQQGHLQSVATNDEYSKAQKAGVSNEVKDLYVQVMDNSGATPTLKADLNGTNKSLLFAVSKADASEAEVMDALQNRTSEWNSGTPVASPVGRNGITLTTNANISNTETQIVNGVDDQPITKIAGTAITAGQVAKIDIDKLATGTYAYVYCTTVPSTNEKVYHVAAATSTNYTDYYKVELSNNGTDATLGSGSTAEAGKVYFIKNLDEENHFVSYTFKQTKVGDNVAGLVSATIPGSKATSTDGYAASADKIAFFFDVYNQNNGAYAVKVIKVVN